jgi:hypothetical protein
LQTLRQAATILSRISSACDAALLLPALGFSADAAQLDRETLRSLGLHNLATAAYIARGSGTLRALVIESNGQLPLRECTRKAAERLARRTPHILCLIFVLHPEPRGRAIAAWTNSESGPRVAALVVEPEHVVDSDAETLCALAAVRDSVDVLAHSRWVELLGREALTRRFYRALQHCVRSMSSGMRHVATADDRDELALLHLSRVLFLSFLEAKGWLDGDRGFLMRTFNECMASGGNYQARTLSPLVFGTLNTPPRRRAPAARAFGRVPFLNGGLFARTSLEKANGRSGIPDEFFGELFGGVLSRYRFTAREDTTSWSEAAVDPEMLGKAFESLMQSRARHESGAFYTPQAMVERVTHSALLHALVQSTGLAPEQVDATLRGQSAGARAAARLNQCAGDLRVLDPACGSGAFLVHALEKLADLRMVTGDDRPVSVVRRAVLTNSIFGVDSNPMAVWLCELRLWLSIVIDSDESDPQCVPPLPNLDHNVRLGDSLAGGSFQDVVRGAASATAVNSLRQRYMRATGHRKATLGRALDAAERRNAIAALGARNAALRAQRLDLIAAERSRDLFGNRAHRGRPAPPELELLRQKSRAQRKLLLAVRRGAALPFSFASHFAEAAAAGGFDVILGNPPWVRLERIPAEWRAAMRREFEVFRLAGWAPAPPDGSSAPTFGPQVDLSALFVERSLSLLRDGGTMALILPAKLWRSLSGSGLRRLLLRDARLAEMEDWTHSAPAFDAVVYPSLLTACRHAGPDVPHNSTVAAVHMRDRVLRWSVSQQGLPLDSSPGAPWLLLPAEVRRAFDVLQSAGVPMGLSPTGAPRLGVKCGHNAAFVVSLRGGATGASGEASICAGEWTGRIERQLLRPLIRGENVRSWGGAESSEFIIWTHGSDSRALPSLPPLARRWFAQFRTQLIRRSDLKDQQRWWSVFRIEAARSDHWRVVWSDIGRSLRATLLPPASPVVPLNSCYVAAVQDEEDAFALAAWLNAPLSSAWLHALAEPARGGYHRYFSWTLSLLPFPSRWERARALLAPLARRAFDGNPPCDAELLQASLDSFQLPHEAVAPLLTWNSR